MQHARYILLTFAVSALLVGMVVQSAAVSFFAQQAMPDNLVLGLLHMSTGLGAIFATIAFVVLLRYGKAKKFTDEVVGELLKVTWPTRHETIRATTTVILTTLFVSALLGFYDIIWKALADIVLFTEG